MTPFKHAGESSRSSKLICKQTSCYFNGLILVNHGTFRKMSIIEIKIFINSHCANIDPKIFFINYAHYIHFWFKFWLYKKSCEISDNSSA